MFIVSSVSKKSGAQHPPERILYVEATTCCITASWLAVPRTICVWDVACTGGMEGMMDGVKIALFLLFNCGNQRGDASVMMKM